MAAAAMKNLAYYMVNYISPIYLEYAPKGLVIAESKKAKTKSDEAKTQPEEDEEEKVEEDTKRK